MYFWCAKKTLTTYKRSQMNHVCSFFSNTLKKANRECNYEELEERITDRRVNKNRTNGESMEKGHKSTDLF